MVYNVSYGTVVSACITVKSMQKGLQCLQQPWIVVKVSRQSGSPSLPRSCMLVAGFGSNFCLMLDFLVDMAGWYIVFICSLRLNWNNVGNMGVAHFIPLLKRNSNVTSFE